MWTLCPDDKFDECLEVDFPKDRATDIALLNYVDGETTILRGDLREESGVHVSVTVEQSVLTVRFFYIKFQKRLFTLSYCNEKLLRHFFSILRS